MTLNLEEIEKEITNLINGAENAKYTTSDQAFTKPTTAGKTERLHLTMNQQLEHCYNDPEYFKYRYNQIRPHMSLDRKTPAEILFRILETILKNN